MRRIMRCEDMATFDTLAEAARATSISVYRIKNSLKRNREYNVKTLSGFVYGDELTDSDLAFLFSNSKGAK